VAMSADPADLTRFMSFVEVLPCGCWAWTGARSRGRGNKKWYGSFRVGGRVVRAHVWSHDTIGGKVCPPGWHRDHTCRFSLCVAPHHLDATTPEENQRRKVEGFTSPASAGMMSWVGG